MIRSLRVYSVLFVIVTCVVAVVFSSTAVQSSFGGGKGPFVDPDAGLTDAERMQKISDARLEFERKIAAWFAALDPSSLDFSSLEHGEIQAQYEPARQSMDEAVKDSEAIVVGSVKTVIPDREGAVVLVNVQQVMKGQLSTGVVRIRQGSGVWPAPDWKGVLISDHANDPLLLPGQRVVLLLMTTSHPGADFEVQSSTGHYNIEAGRVRATELNPFRSLVNGQPEAALLGQLQSAMARTR